MGDGDEGLEIYSLPLVLDVVHLKLFFILFYSLSIWTVVMHNHCKKNMFLELRAPQKLK